ncbi:glycoside hydrolase family 2 TIM barrel-domain containing protein [Mucilaginibacter terrae]|uniref:glycoside hydrolase family 2 TIM barrel-domain containing protein n=1 Tax=Mucilaginibacter terrae TaxID=1955052 RepID=UPI00289B62EB|nr:glycoside hydrolase family 2 TIM barrel-domain containing protein [Mucilaginibacter terrae]
MVYIECEEGRYRLIKNGRPFLVKGAAGLSQLTTLKQVGGNTIRTWDTLGLDGILKDAAQNDLSVIVGLYMPDNQRMDEFYNNRKAVQTQFKAYKKLISRYKNHPALLCWCLGNELPFPLKPSYNGFYATFNSLVDMIHTVDPSHPVTTTMVNFQPQNIFNIKHRTNVDFISINTFGELKNLEQSLDKYEWLWDGPFLVTEWGIDGPWLEHKQTAWRAYIEETSTKKADQYLAKYQNYMPVDNGRFLGSLVFYWGQKQETTPTWFSMFDQQGNRSEAINAMQYLWTAKKSEIKTPQLNYMLLNEKGAHDNVFIKPGSTVKARVLLNDADSLKYDYEWQVQPEDWYKINNQNNSKPLKPVTPAQTGLGKTGITFTAPLKEGAYRVYVYVRGKNQTFATSNTPFYVLPNP